MHECTGKLTAAAPFDFDQSLRFIGVFNPMQGEQAVGPRSLVKAVYVAGQHVVFRIESIGSTDKPEFAYTVYSDSPISAEVERSTIDRMRFFLSMDDNLESFYEIGRDDPHFAPVIEKLYGYHQVKFLTPFENACWAVLTQRNQIPVAKKMKAALVDTLSSTLTINDVQYSAFPEPHALLEAGEVEIAKLIHHEPKAAFLAAVAKAFSGADESFLRYGPLKEVETWLRGIHGIGEWSATFILVRGLGRVEFLPIEKRLLAAASERYQRVITEKVLTELAEPYGAWRGYWAHYLRAAS
jgi:DNA-3-methyladenine glycosylase II